MFVHTHVHSEFSPLDGMGKIKELVEQAVRFGNPGLALTDHASTSGLYELQKECDKAKIKPILGSEFYLSQQCKKNRGHLILLAKNNNGLKNIYLLQEYAYRESFNRKPLINIDILKQYSTDLICTSACIANVIPQFILEGKYNEAEELALLFKSIFGDDFYLEIQSNTIPEQKIVNEGIVSISKKTDIKLVLTNDIHYVYKEDANIHEVMLALQQNKKMDDEKRWSFSTKDYYYKTEEEMKKDVKYLPDDVIKSALNNTLEIMDKCNARIEKGNYLPSFPLKDKTEEERLRELTTEKYKKRVKQGMKHTKERVERIERELKVIEDMGYSGYFLIVQDYVNWAKENDIYVGDGRGSGAGSEVAYIIGITEVDPLQYDLLFERFLTPGRIPDFDVDFSDSEAVFRYLQDKYGKHNVARVGAFNTITAKSGIGDVFRIFNFPDSLTAKIKGCLPKKIKFTLKEALEESKELRGYKKKYPLQFKIVERLEGLRSGEGTHAGGVIIYDGLNKLAPLRTKAEDRTKSIIGYDKDMLEELGFYKFDLLWLQSLKVVGDTIKSIERYTEEKIDLLNINYEDKNIYDMLCRGHVLGVFQLAEQKDKTVEQQPKNFKDLIAINALIRPGVGDWNEYIKRRRGKKWSIHKKRMPYLKETEGLITYQEQFLLDCKTFAGWSLAYADKHVRKNKDITNDVELETKFFYNVTEHGYSKPEAHQLWKEIVDAVSGGYSFNKSHSASYARLTYITAYLKYYYPQYFYSALMTSSNSKSTELAQKEISEILVEVKERGIKILPPDMNESDDNFRPTKEGIRYSIASIRNVGESAVNHIKEIRPIESLDDVLKRSKKKYLRKNVMDMIIKAGCFDFENPNREEMLKRYYDWRKEEYEMKDWNQEKLLEYEKETLGFYLTKHPMDKYSFKYIDDYNDGDSCVLGGEVIEVTERYDKNGGKMAFITLNSNQGNIKCLVFATIWNKRGSDIQDVLKENNIVLVEGKKDKQSCLVFNAEIIEGDGVGN